jgi:hypothetical protein
MLNTINNSILNILEGRWENDKKIARL